MGGFVHKFEKVQYEDSIELNWFDKDSWEAVSGVSDLNIRITGSSKAIYVISNKDGEAIKLSCTFEEKVDLSAYNELTMVALVNNGEGCTYSITYHYDGGSYTDSATSRNNSKNTVFFRLPPENSDSIKRIELTVDNEAGNINYFAIEGFTADNNRTYSYGERFLSRKVSVSGGDAAFYDDYVEFVPSESGAYILCDLISDYGQKNVLAVVEIHSSNAGILTVENPSTGKTISTAMYSGTASYSFKLSELEKNLRISFSEGDISVENPFRFISLKIIPLTAEESTKLGTIDSCVYENGKISVRGTVDSDAAIEYINAKIALYKIPYDYSGELPADSEAEMSISTVYEIEAAADYDYTKYKYIIALKTKNKAVPIADPVFAIGKSSLPMVSQDCRIGLHNAESSAVFESETEDVVLDVYTDHLFATSGKIAAVRFSYRDNVFYIDSDYVNELALNIDFFTSVGEKVYLRLLSDEEGEFVFDASQPSSVELMCAAAAYIGSHFEKASGVILLSGFHYGDDPEKKAEQASSLTGLFASALRNVNEKIEIFVSLSKENGYISALLAENNKKNGVSNIGLVYECKDQTYAVSEVKSVCDAASAYGSPFRRSVVFWKVKRDAASAEQFKRLYENAEQSAVSSVIFSVSDAVTSDEIYNCFEGIHGSEHRKYSFEAFEAEVDYRGEYKLWDFTEAYNTFGWLAGGSCSAPETAKSLFEEGRALRSIVTPDYDNEGILVGWFERITDLSVADILRIDLAVSKKHSNNIPISVVVGGNGVKAEYKTQLNNGSHSVCLDLSSYPQSVKVEYIAVIIESDREATLEISGVSMFSRTLSDDELQSSVKQTSESIESYSYFYVFIGAVVSSAIIVFLALSKKKTQRNNDDK